MTNLDECIKLKFHGITYDITIRKPNICPKCNQGMIPTIESKTDLLIRPNQKAEFFMVTFFCPCCFDAFVERYNLYNMTPVPMGYPINKACDKEVSDAIKNLSPDFYEIYSQALTAEKNNLNEISGMAFRKSIEFLIKDFLIISKEHPEDEISKLPLQKAINLIDNERIRTLATACVWLGNDETHYIKKHTDRGQEDIKIFIKSLYSFIHHELIVSDALSFVKK